MVDFNRFWSLIFWLFSSVCLFSQGIQQEFGKNRIQYHNGFDEWSKYESEHFITYWYGEARMVGQSVSQLAELDYPEIQNVLEYQPTKKIEILVFVDQTDLKQSNIGNDEALTQTDDLSHIDGDKVFVHFDGDHPKLRRQIREGVASILMNNMLFGSTLQEMIQNALQLNLPPWYKNGLISYCAEPWSTTLDDQFKAILTSGRYKNFNAISRDHPRLAGHAFWYFLGIRYGRSTISNVLYLTRINRSEESGFLYNMGNTTDEITGSCLNYFSKRYDLDNKNLIPLETKPEKNSTVMSTKENGVIPIKNKWKSPITDMKISHDGKYLAYVTNDIGRTRVYLKNLKDNTTKRIFIKGYRNKIQKNDVGYPLVAWSRDSKEICIMYEKRDRIIMKRIPMDKKKKVEFDEFTSQIQRVHSLDYMPGPNLLITATVRGVSDVFIYRTKNRQLQRLTNDFYDDLDASYFPWSAKKDSTEDTRLGILFSSNRPDSSLIARNLDSLIPTGKMDIFFLEIGNSNSLGRITHTPEYDEKNPRMIDSTSFTFLSDKGGVWGLQTSSLKDTISRFFPKILFKDGTSQLLQHDSLIAKIDTSIIQEILSIPEIYTKGYPSFSGITNSRFDKSITNYVNIPNSDNAIISTYSLRKKGNSRPIPQLNLIKVDTGIFSRSNNFLNPGEVKAAMDSLKSKSENDSIAKSLESQYYFLSEFEEPEESKTQNQKSQQERKFLDEEKSIGWLKPEKTESKSFLFRPARITPYRLSFRSDYVNTTLDNTQLFGGLNQFTADSRDPFAVPILGPMLRVKMKDVLEDYIVDMGVRIPILFNGGEYFISFENRKNRIDAKYTAYYKGLNTSNNRTLTGVGGQPVRVVDRNTILLGAAEFRYPLDVFTSLRTQIMVRNDRRTSFATERRTLFENPVDRQRLGLRLEYVFDNSISTSPNMMTGTRWKLFGEVLKRFEFSTQDRLSFNWGSGAMGIAGVDARHYRRLDRHSIIALRGAGATSFGQENILYVLGGMDGSLINTQNNNISFPSINSGFAFTALAAQMRGFLFNSRNGSNYALVNNEVRVPIFRYLSKKPLRRAFWRDFQLTGFLDAGTAWTGISPYLRNNPISSLTIRNGEIGNESVILQVNYFKDPILIGYGLGTRFSLFGYLIKLDYGWGIETRVVQKPVLHFSIGQDF
jgi:hypothetical protein